MTPKIEFPTVLSGVLAAAVHLHCTTYASNVFFIVGITVDCPPIFFNRFFPYPMTGPSSEGTESWRNRLDTKKVESTITKNKSVIDDEITLGWILTKGRGGYEALMLWCNHVCLRARADLKRPLYFLEKYEVARFWPATVARANTDIDLKKSLLYYAACC